MVKAEVNKEIRLESEEQNARGQLEQARYQHKEKRRDQNRQDMSSRKSEHCSQQILATQRAK